MRNSKHQFHRAAYCMYHRQTNFSKLLNRSPTKTKKSLKERDWSFLEKKSQEKDHQRKKDETERATGISKRRRRAETVKWNQMTAMRLQTGGRHQTSPASFGLIMAEGNRVGEGDKEQLVGGFKTNKQTNKEDRQTFRQGSETKAGTERNTYVHK